MPPMKKFNALRLLPKPIVCAKIVDRQFTRQECPNQAKHNHRTSCHLAATDLQVYTPDTQSYIEQLQILMMLQLSQ